MVADLQGLSTNELITKSSYLGHAVAGKCQPQKSPWLWIIAPLCQLVDAGNAATVYFLIYLGCRRPGQQERLKTDFRVWWMAAIVFGNLFIWLTYGGAPVWWGGSGPPSGALRSRRGIFLAALRHKSPRVALLHFNCLTCLKVVLCALQQEQHGRRLFPGLRREAVRRRAPKYRSPHPPERSGKSPQAGPAGWSSASCSFSRNRTSRQTDDLLW